MACRIRSDIQQEASATRNLVTQCLDALSVGKIILGALKTVVPKAAADSAAFLPGMVFFPVGLRARMVVFGGVVLTSDSFLNTASRSLRNSESFQFH